MIYKFDFYPYQRRFRQPLKTSHGIWKTRAGINFSLTNEMDKIGWGEIAPLPWFGSESLEQALTLCQQFGARVTDEDITQIPQELSACQFGFGSALEDLSSRVENKDKNLSYSYLLPTGEAGLEACQQILQRENLGRSPTTFKWKIGVSSIEEEVKIFTRLIKILPIGGKLRLDANGGLNLPEAKKWLELADRVGTIEFIEQPLSPECFDLMLNLSADYATAIALDESVATVRQLEDCYYQGWKGIYVIKPAIAGFPQHLRRFCREHSIDAVFSSVFETKVGRKAVLNLAAELSNRDRAVGFGVNDWFENEL